MCIACQGDSQGNSGPNGTDILADVPGDISGDSSTDVTECSSDDECSDGICIEGACVALNQKPVAVAGDDAQSEMGVAIIVDGSASYDPEGATLTYLWSFTAVPQGSGLSTVFAEGSVFSFLPDVTGEFELSLVVSDGEQESEADTINFTVIEGTKNQLAELGEACTSHLDCKSLNCVNAVCSENLPPFSFAGKDTYAATGSLVRFFGGESFDPEGSFLSYTWSLISGPEGAEPVILNPYSSSSSSYLELPGTYVFSLVVHDGLQPSEQDEVVVTVADPDFQLQPYVAWIEPGVEVYKLSNINFRRTRFEDAESYGLPGQVIVESTLWTPDYESPEISHLGVSAVDWLDGVGRVVFGNSGDLGISLFHPPLVGLPHGLFIDQEIVATSRFTAPQADGTVSDTIHKKSYRAIGLTNIQTTFGAFSNALEYVVVTQVGTGLPSEKTCWLVEGVGAVRCQRAYNGNEDHPPGVEERAGQSFEVEEYPSLVVPVLERDVPAAAGDIQIDGEVSDWDGVPYVWEDPMGDHFNPGGSLAIDLSGVQVQRTETHLYIHITVHDPPVNADVMYSIDLMQTMPMQGADDYSIWIRKDNGYWSGSLEQLVAFGNPAHLGSVAMSGTSQGLELRIPLNVSGNESSVTVHDVVDGGYIRVSACLNNQDTCTDQFMSSNRMHLTD
jgi:hypothetical protein